MSSVYAGGKGGESSEYTWAVGEGQWCASILGLERTGTRAGFPQTVPTHTRSLGIITANTLFHS